MTQKLLDTTFLIHYWAGRNDARRYLEKHEDDSEFLTTAINLKEIAVGQELQGRLDREDLLSTFGWLTIVPFTVEHAFVAGQLEASLRSRTDLQQDKVNALAGDLLIAAVAKQVGAPVVTENTDDFELFDEVPVERY